MTFEPAMNTGPHTINLFTANNDPHDVLPPAAQKKWTALVQRAIDAHNSVPEFAIRQEAAEAVTGIQRRIADLKRLKSEGGAYGLSDDAATVIAEHKKLERAMAERDRQQALYEIRSARWNVAKQLEVRVSDFVLRGGIPGDCQLDVVDDAPPLSELLKKGERIADGVERYRHRLRELAADRHRLRSSPFPASVQKEKAKAQIEQWAEAATPNFESMIEHNAGLAFRTMSLSSLVRGEKPVLAFTEETTDTLGLLCWLFKDELLAKINAGLDEVADDKAALSQQQREQMEAQISSDVLAIERAEVACIWAAEAAGEILDFRSATSPQSLLGVRLVNRPRASPSGTTSAGHAFDIVMPGQQR
jgi:hypothetical protein